MPGRESQKRKRKGRRPAGTPEGAPQGAPAPRSKDDIAREALVPLEAGERPTAVTVAAIVAGLIAATNVIGLVAGIEIDGRSFSAGEVLPPAVLMGVAAVGMWFSRYWAVLGFQTILAFLIVVMSLALITAENVLGVVVALAIVSGAGALFWSLVKAMARIQMPQRR